MLCSGNDAAFALAEYVGGNIEELSKNIILTYKQIEELTKMNIEIYQNIKERRGGSKIETKNKNVIVHESELML